MIPVEMLAENFLVYYTQIADLPFKALKVNPYEGINRRSAYWA